MSREQMLPPPKTSGLTLPGVTNSVYEDDLKIVQNRELWLNTAQVEVITNDRSERIRPRNAFDQQFIKLLSELQRDIASSVNPNSMTSVLEIGNALGLSLSAGLDAFGAINHIETTDLSQETVLAFQSLAPRLSSEIDAAHTGTLNTVVDLSLSNKNYDLVQGVRSFGNCDTREDELIIEHYLYWIGQIQNRGGVLVATVFSDEFLDIASQAWKVPIERTYRKTYSNRERLETALETAGYSAINIRSYSHYEGMKKYFGDTITSPDPGITHYLFAAKKKDNPVNHNHDKSYLRAWVDTYHKS